jgi:PKD repeat protein
MKHLFTSLLCLIVLSASAQISFLASDAPAVGFQLKTAKDTVVPTTINYGNAGPNQVYDFSNYQPMSYDTTLYLALTNAQQTKFPNADVAVTTDNYGFLYTNTTANAYLWEGLEGEIQGYYTDVQFSPQPKVYQFPTDYGNNFTGTWGFTKTVSGANVGQPFVYQVRVTNTSTYWDTIDGWGKVKTPYGVYDCLRQKRKEISYTAIDIKLTAISGWSNFDNIYDTTLTYGYLTKEAKGSIVSFAFDTLDNLKSVQWGIVAPPPPVANFTWVNTAGGLVDFTDASTGFPTTYSWLFDDGGAAGFASPSHVYSANGAYNVCLTVTNNGGSDTYCDTVYVTGISAVNNAPVTEDDTATLDQPTDFIYVEIGFNDLDPNGDNFCLTDVYDDMGWGDIAPTGNCTTVSYNPDSTFSGVDTVWYVICDQGPLCDTGMLIINVNAEPAPVPPIASFTWYQQSVCDSGVFINTSQLDTETPMWIFSWYNQIPPFIDTLYGDTVAYIGYGGFYVEFGVELIVSNADGSATVADSVWLQCESIKETLLSGINLFPNPASGYVTIDMANNTDDITRKEARIELQNTIGQTVLTTTKEASQKQITLNTANLPQGLYIATITDGKMRKTLGKVTIE